MFLGVYSLLRRGGDWIGGFGVRAVRRGVGFVGHGVTLVLRLPPGFSPAVQFRRIGRLTAGAKTDVTFAAVLPTEVMLAEGDLYMAVKANGRGAKGNVRLWLAATHAKSVPDRDVPRNRCRSIGPLRADELPSEETLPRISSENGRSCPFLTASNGTQHAWCASTPEPGYAPFVVSCLPAGAEGERCRASYLDFRLISA